MAAARPAYSGRAFNLRCPLPLSLPARKQEILVLGRSAAHPPLATSRSGAQGQGQRECASLGPPEMPLQRLMLDDIKGEGRGHSREIDQRVKTPKRPGQNEKMSQEAKSQEIGMG